jgi:hypothetical protein
MDREKEQAFLDDFVKYLRWAFAGARAHDKPTEPSVTFATLLDELAPPGEKALRDVLLKHMEAMQEAPGRKRTDEKT